MQCRVAGTPPRFPIYHRPNLQNDTVLYDTPLDWSALRAHDLLLAEIGLYRVENIQTSRPYLLVHRCVRLLQATPSVKGSYDRIAEPLE